MDLTIITESSGGSTLSWLGSRRGTDSARTVTLDRASLTSEVVAAGLVPAGTPLASAGSKVVPYTGAAGQVLAGFLLTDQRVKPGGGDIVAPLIDHGRVIVGKLPLPFIAPSNATSFVFV